MTLIERDSERSVPEAAGWTALHEECAAEVYRYVYKRCGDADLADDIAQDAFVRAMEAAEDPAEVTVAWMITVARNRLIDVLRRRARFDTKLRLVGTPDDHADEGQILAEGLVVHDALNTLKVEYRLVLVLHYMDGLPVAELADQMGRSVEAVKSLVRRARRQFVAELERTDA